MCLKIKLKFQNMKLEFQNMELEFQNMGSGFQNMELEFQIKQEIQQKVFVRNLIINII